MEQKLETFLTLCQTLHYGRAAERLHLSQPAVSKQIQSLEAYYGVRLFRYDGRKLSKTPQGELLERYPRTPRCTEDPSSHRRNQVDRRLHPPPGDLPLSARSGA